MKMLTGLLLFMTLPAGYAGNFFTLSFTKLDGTTVSTSDYTGKKVIVFAFNGAHPDLNLLIAMDSIQRAYPDSLQVLAFPALELDSSANSQTVGNLVDSLGLQLVVGSPALVKISSGAGQIPLFTWLTSVQGNGHFDRDMEEEGMLFIVNNTGNLYSILNRGLYRAILPSVLSTATAQ